VKVPHPDRLARQGVRLTSFYVSWPACTPSRGSLLTGRYPQRHGVYDMIHHEAPDYGKRYTLAEYAVTFERIGGMDTREVLLPRMLKRGGYVSGIYGKWDLGVHRRFLPRARGFDDFYGFVNTGIDYYTHERHGVPCIVRYPGRIRPNTVCDALLTSMEIVPTVLAAAGIEPPRGVVLDGFDMMPVLARGAASGRTEMFWQRKGDRAARVGTWKWVQSARGTGLFDLATDLGERHDLPSKHPEKFRELQRRFLRWRDRMDQAEPRGPFRDY
jgi:arylsulfatase A-like enzyme